MKPIIQKDVRDNFIYMLRRHIKLNGIIDNVYSDISQGNPTINIIMGTNGLNNKKYENKNNKSYVFINIPMFKIIVETYLKLNINIKKNIDFCTNINKIDLDNIIHNNLYDIDNIKYRDVIIYKVLDFLNNNADVNVDVKFIVAGIIYDAINDYFINSLLDCKCGCRLENNKIECYEEVKYKKCFYENIIPFVKNIFIMYNKQKLL